MVIPPRLCWEQLDSVWMNWLLKSQLHPELPVKTCPHCAHLHAASLSPEAFSFCFSGRSPRLHVHTSLGEGSCSWVPAPALPWSVPGRPGTSTGLLTPEWSVTAIYCSRAWGSHTPDWQQQEYPAKSLATIQYWFIGGHRGLTRAINIITTAPCLVPPLPPPDRGESQKGREKLGERETQFNKILIS